MVTIVIDLILLSVPGTISKTPPAAPAVLKAACVHAGVSCRFIDYNIRLYHEISPDNYRDLETYFCVGSPKHVAVDAEKLISKWAMEVANLSPKFVGISVFTYQCMTATKLFCKYLRQYSNAKIILGGQGIANGGINGDLDIVKNMVSDNLADYWIRGEGEWALPELLANNLTYAGINSEIYYQKTKTEKNLIPDYSDYDFSQYQEHELPITGSYGCVRKCSFCDVHEYWKYQFRTGKDIFDELTVVSQQTGIKKFQFSDSLVNGNLREFNIFCTLMADYNLQTSEPITWSGQFIIRPEKVLSEEFWKTLAASGATKLAIGIETGSDQVREHMNKKFTNKDIDYTMRMLDKYNITCVFLMIIGYPTETIQDFQETLDMMSRYQQYANRIINDVEIGNTLGILPGTPLHYRAEEYNIELDSHELNWISWDNPSLTLTERIRRRREFKKHIQDLGYIKSHDDSELLVDVLESNLKTFEKKTHLKKLIKIKNIK